MYSVGKPAYKILLSSCNSGPTGGIYAQVDALVSLRSSIYVGQLPVVSVDR